jgi:hypothetical protein
VHLTPGRPAAGIWRIGLLDAMSAIRVEDKRPTFEVRFRPRTKPARLNEPVELEGGALLSAPITSGRVAGHRATPDPPRCGGNEPPAKPQRIASGDTALKPDGTFAVTFTAAADPRKAARPEAAFRYTVRA